MKTISITKRKKQESGYNLLELIITLVVFSILTSIAVPATIDWRISHRINKISILVSNDLATSRLLSISKNRSVFIDFAPATNSYSIFIDANNDGEGTANEEFKFVSFSEMDSLIVFGSNSNIGVYGGDLLAPVDFSNTTRVLFRPNGTVQNSGALYLLPLLDIAKRDDRQRAVSVTGLGRISRWSYDESQPDAPWRKKI
jgi:prepilin-type N-terminal cleavage/methylation domain-containing protein